MPEIGAEVHWQKAYCKDGFFVFINLNFLGANFVFLSLFNGSNEHIISVFRTLSIIFDGVLVNDEKLLFLQKTFIMDIRQGPNDISANRKRKERYSVFTFTGDHLRC